MAPTSRLENPSTRVYSSPKPTHPDSSTMGELRARPQKSTRRDPSFDVPSAWAAAFMRRALYDARPMQTQALRISLLSALVAASTLAVAQSPAPAASPASTGPRFSESDEIPSPKGFNDAYTLDEIRIGGAVY